MDCPICGAPMVERVARTGPRAGSRFWGCSRYPACRGIVNHESAGVGDDRVPTSASRTSLRRTWSDYGSRGAWTSFYAPAGGRLRAWDPTLTRSTSRAVSQAAFYLSGFPDSGPSDDSVTISVLRRALARGDRPPVDPAVEDSLLELSGLTGTLPRVDPGEVGRRLSPGAALPDANAVSNAIAWRLSFLFDTLANGEDDAGLFGSDEERAAYQNLIDLAPHQQLGHFIVPQAAFASLLGEPADARRADFLISHPGADPWVLEFDGDHAPGVEVDRDRDQALEAGGVEVRRIATTDVGSSAWRELLTLIPKIAAEPTLAHQQLTWGGAVAHRIFRGLLEGLARGALNGDGWSIELHEPLGIGLVAVQSALEVIAATSAVWSEGLAPDLVHVTADGKSVALRWDAGRYVVESDGLTPAEIDLAIHVQPYHGPWHELPQVRSVPTIVVRSACLPFDLKEGRQEGRRHRRVPDVDRVPRDALVRLLQAWFGKREFYPPDAPEPRGQEVAIRRLLAGRDSVVLLPTGAGKSLIYQMAVCFCLAGR
jgi:hypothetical protein